MFIQFYSIRIETKYKFNWQKARIFTSGTNFTCFIWKRSVRGGFDGLRLSKNDQLISKIW